jgi:hypothetical protein
LTHSSCQSELNISHIKWEFYNLPYTS